MDMDQDNRLQELGSYFTRLYDKLKGERENWDSHWDDVARYTRPNNDDVYNKRTQGDKRHNRLYDSTSIQANKFLASSLHGSVTNPASVWFDLKHPDPDINSIYGVRLWMQDSVKRMTAVLNQSNFQSQIHEVYLDLPSIATATMYMGEDKDKTIYFRAKPIYNFVVKENHMGIVDTVGELREYTYKQIVDEYGMDNVPESLKAQGNSSETRLFDIITFVEPNKDYREGQPNIKTNMPFRSIHVLRKTHTVLRESGYNSFPYAVPRWTKYTGETYGRGPGMETLPDTKMLNAMSKVVIRGAQKVVDPPLVVPDSGFALPLDTRPGGSIYKTMGIQDEIKPLLTGARPDIGEELMEPARQRIRQAFFMDQMQLVNQNNMTATEVMQRREENLRTLSPIYGRINHELLKPIVDRLFDIMIRKNMFAELPEELGGADLEVQYVSQIAKAQKSGEADTLNRVLQSIMPVLESNPEIMDNFNGDEVLKHHASIFGLSEKMMNDPAEVAKIREQRSQQQQEQEDAALNNQDADTMQKMAQAQGQGQGAPV